MILLEEREKLNIGDLVVYNDEFNTFTFNGKQSNFDYGLVVAVSERSITFEWLADGERATKLKFDSERTWQYISLTEE